MILMNLNFVLLDIDPPPHAREPIYDAWIISARTILDQELKEINYIYIIVIENETITRNILIDDDRRRVLPVVARSVEDDGAFLRIIFVERYIV